MRELLWLTKKAVFRPDDLPSLPMSFLIVALRAMSFSHPPRRHVILLPTMPISTVH